MELFAKKCEYCRTKIEKGKEVRRDVKISGYMGTYPKNFCSEEHIRKYEQELENHMKNSKKSGCCG